MNWIISVFTITFVCLVIYLIKIGVRYKHFFNAAVEVIVVYIISNMPILFLLWASYSNLSMEENESPEALLQGFLNGGDIFIYVSAIVAPVAWALISYFKESHRILTGFYMVTLLLILPFSAFTFQQARLTDNLNQNAMDMSSLFLYGISLMLWYGAIVYKCYIENYEPPASGNIVLNNLQGGN